MSGEHLVTFHIGPVQDFIAAARRTRDLWFGSWLLSELAVAAATEIARRNGDPSCLIFPAVNDWAELQSEGFRCPNKIVALIGQPPAELGQAVHEAILNRLRTIRDRTYDDHVKGDFDRATAVRQVEDLVEFYWAGRPIEGHYHEARNRTEAAMAARKVTREFAPVTWGGPAPKCSLDGQRESVIPESAYKHMTERQLRMEYGVGQAERLCGVGLLKRHGQRGKGDRFLSTSHVAALPLLARLRDHSATEEYLKTLKSLGVSAEALDTCPMHHPVLGRNDGHLLFEERLGDFFDDEGDFRRAKQALRVFLGKALDGESPLPYYALLRADGDRIGEVVNAQETVEQHRRLSTRLSHFARRVADLVGECGSLAYSGGDDVLAFVPVHKVLACARDLALAFRQGLAEFKVSGNGIEAYPTLSVGIVVAHHLEPLSDVLALARTTESVAKSVSGKNALAITVGKRSGPDRTVCGTWGTLDERLEQFIELHRTEALPDAAGYDLCKLALLLNTADQKDRKKLERAGRAESIRILGRKEARRGLQPVADDVLRRLEELINERQVSILQLADELIVARLFAEVARQAGIGAEDPIGRPLKEE